MENAMDFVQTYENTLNEFRQPQSASKENRDAHVVNTMALLAVLGEMTKRLEDDLYNYRLIAINKGEGDCAGLPVTLATEERFDARKCLSMQPEIIGAICVRLKEDPALLAKLIPSEAALGKILDAYNKGHSDIPVAVTENLFTRQEAKYRDGTPKLKVGSNVESDKRVGEKRVELIDSFVVSLKSN